ncbi:GH32 C-terminal domain-containing protein [Sutcliffiella deserti]|uniref:GH32 C-terminal domain-containing protein n=1 Tax=Sutcliffiella deserti TaxID=2875501 RepID=UPI001CBAF9CB|nr:GH32 C-terminal domain-containing protein [Sutcliffiella deserti]
MNKSIKTDLIARWCFEEQDGTKTLDEVTNIHDKVQYIFEKALFQPDRQIKRRKGISGNALWFDGFSVYIQRDGRKFTYDKGALTFSLWIAPHAFGGIEDERLTALINQHHLVEEKGFILGFHKHGQLSFQLGLTSGWEEVWGENHFLPKDVWSHVVATFDSHEGFMKLYLNGDLIGSKKTQGGKIVPAEVDLIVGKNNNPFVVADTFSLNTFMGLMDKVEIYRRALGEDEILKQYHSYLEPVNGRIPHSISYETISIDRADFTADRHRPQYHATAPGHWMNEPHAPLYFKGKYHLFYQHNPQGPYWGNIHWGHWVSEDLIHWKDQPVALAPDQEEVDPDGTWSGCAHYDENGLPVLFFTAGNHRYLPNQMIGLARSTFEKDGDLNLAKWEKHQDPVIFQPEGYQLDDDGFRDPFVWKEEDTWFQIVGSGINGKGGTALLFESTNIIDWHFKGCLYVSDVKKYPYLGRVWELPIMLPLGKNRKGEEKHIFIISPVGEGADVEVFYWVGTWDKMDGKFTPDQEDPQLFDLGDFHFTGPSAMVDPVTKKLILFTIAQGERPVEYEYASGWAHNAGMPVEIYLGTDDRMRIKPVDQVKELRNEKLIDIKNKTIAEVNEQLEQIQGDMLEIKLKFKNAYEGRYGLFLRQAMNRSEETLFYYDHSQDSFFVDRNKTSLDKKERTKGIQGGEVNLENEPLEVRFLLDKSLVEVYVNEIKSLTTRVYPACEESKGITLFGAEHLIIESMEIWSMNGIN